MDMIATSRIALVLTGSVCTAVVALAGCSSGTPAAPAVNPAPAAPSASTAAPSASTAAPSASTAAPTASTAAPSASTVVPSASAVAAAPSVVPSAGAGVLTAAISGLPAAPVLAFGGQSAKFTVTLRNGSGSTYRDITPLVSIGHCSCSTSPAAVAPAGTLQELDPSTGNWRPVSYVTEGTGMDYLLASTVQQSPVTLAPGVTASFTFRLALAPLADQSPTERAGQASVDVTLVRVPSRALLGPSPTASLPITVTMPAS